MNGGPASAAGTPTSVVRAVYEAINDRDYEAGFALLDDRFEWVEPEQGLLGGTHRGSDPPARTGWRERSGG
jgi:ketosteroid isomerase-like protein